MDTAKDIADLVLTITIAGAMVMLTIAVWRRR